MLPARSWMSAPERLTRDSRTEATVTGAAHVEQQARFRVFSAPNCAVAYHWLYPGPWPRFPAIASAAFCGLSPSARPAGPNAATLAGASACTATGLAEERRAEAGGGLGRAGLGRAALDRRGAGRRIGVAARRGGTRAGRGRGLGPAHAGDELVAGEAEDRQDQHGQEGGPAHPPPLPLPERHGRLEGLGCRDLLGRPPGRVELVNQRHGILPHGAGDGADVAARIEVTAARSVVILLYTPDDGFRDTGAAD